MLLMLLLLLLLVAQLSSNGFEKNELGWHIAVCLQICLVEPKLDGIKGNMEMRSEWLKLFSSDTGILK